MNRNLIVFAGACLILLVGPEWAFAQDWSYSGDPLERGSGFYLAWPKILGLWIVFLMWVYTTDWVSRDTDEIGEGIGMPAHIWNPIIVFSFLPIFAIVALVIPLYAISIGLVVLAYFVPIGIYVFQRNAKVQDDEKVMTAAHIKLWFMNIGKKRKAKPQKKMSYEDGPPIEFSCHSAPTEADNQTNLISARQSPAFVSLKELVDDIKRKRASRCVLDYTKDSVAVKYEVDGLWHNLDPRDRESYDMLLAVLKKMCNMKIEDRRSRQEGYVKFKVARDKWTLTLTTQGTPTGERALLDIDDGGKNLKTLELLGMREKLRDRAAIFLKQKGIVIISSLPQGGLTTSTVATINHTDRMLRDFSSIQDKANLLPYVENLDVAEYDAAAGETPDQMIHNLSLKQPDAFVVPDLPNAETVRKLCEQVNVEDRLVVVSVRAKEAVEALLRVLLLKAPAEEFAQAVTAVINQRLVRRLCESCKQPYEPPPQLLQRLGIPQGRVQFLYREWQPPPPGQETKKGEPEVCPDCHGVGYRGRIGIFELLEVTDPLRKGLVDKPNLDSLRQIAKQGGTRNIQEEGILMVAQGVTSLNELQRVLKT
jgi:type II secretory ATPase GspE/PulE/Tfp pilus assembly ATPase PilB-like protein